MAAPPIGVLFPILISQSRLKGTPMQIQLDNIGGSERPLRQVGKEEFIDHACTRDANRTFLSALGMSGHYHAARHTFGANRHFWTVVEASHDLAFRTLLKLIRGQMQTRLDERMIEHFVVFAS